MNPDPNARTWAVKDSGHRRNFESGAQRDRAAGKGRPVLLSPYSYMRIAKVAEQGEVKYDTRNWELGMHLSQFIDSAERHLQELKMGLEDEDHAAQCAWNIMGYIHTEEMIRRGLLPVKWDDMPRYEMLTNGAHYRTRINPESAANTTPEEETSAG